MAVQADEEKERIRRLQEFFGKELGGRPYQMLVTYQKGGSQFSTIAVSNADWNKADFNTVRGLLSGLQVAVNDILKNAFPQVRVLPGHEEKKPEEPQYR